MRGRFGQGLVLLLGGLTVTACGPLGWKAQHPGYDDAASATPDRVIIEAKAVWPMAFVGGKPTSCMLDYAVFNNTDADLTAANTQLGSYAITVPPLPKYAQFMHDLSDDTAPVNGSCMPVAQSVLRAAQSLPSIACTLNGLSADDCAARAQLLVKLDSDEVARITQDEAAEQDQYASAQVEAFDQAKAQAWATRGRYQQSVNAALTQANPAATLSLIGTDAAGYDPAVPPTVPPLSTQLAFCPQFPLAAGATPPRGRLTVLKIERDQFGLADWYRIQLSCHGVADKTAWVRAQGVERLVQAGQLVKPLPPPAPQIVPNAAAAKDLPTTKPTEPPLGGQG